MKKLGLAVLISTSLIFAGCGRELETPKKTYPTYGILNQDKLRSENVCYEVSIGNVVWSIILIETIIAPVYFIGFSIFNPVRLKKSPTDKCGIDAE